MFKIKRKTIVKYYSDFGKCQKVKKNFCKISFFAKGDKIL